jgi:hypothetical protein
MQFRLDNLGPSSQLVWHLTKEQVEYIQVHYKYTVLPHIYKIRTQKFKNSKNKPSIIKEINNGAYQGKKTINKKLNKTDMKTLDVFQIDYIPIKYLIVTS